MTTQKFQLHLDGFTGGLNTQSSVLNVLPSEFMDGSVNVELQSNGSLRRRRGVDFIGEISSGVTLATLDTFNISIETNQESINAYRVRISAPNGDLLDRIVVDIKNQIWVYKNTLAALTNPANPFQKLSPLNPVSEAQRRFPLSFAPSGNKLFFAGLHTNPGYLKVDADNVSLTLVSIDVLVRDPNATAANTRRKDGSKWYECIEAHTSAAAVNQPGAGSNWEQFWFELDAPVPAGAVAWADTTAYTTIFIKQYNKNQTPGTSDTFPTTVEFYAGRVWLAGDPRKPNRHYFSQVITNDADIEKYHQYADPFDASDPDLVDDDGGTIDIQGAGLTKQLLTVSNSLFVGHTNGVNQITGADKIFKATNFSNHLVLTDEVPSGFSMTKAAQEFYIFGRDSIWRSTISNELSDAGDIDFVNVSEHSVDSLYSAIPLTSKAAARALYNPSERQIFYFFNKERISWDISFNTNNQLGYSKNVLVVSTAIPSAEEELQERKIKHIHSAFFEYTLDDGAEDEKPYIAAPFIAPDLPNADEVVQDNAGNTVVDGSAATVFSFDDAQAKDTVMFVILRRSFSTPTVTLEHAFGTFETSNLTDWTTNSTYKISYASKIVGGINTLGDPSRTKAATYIWFVFKKVETGVLVSDVDTNPGGCFLRTAWEYAVNTTSNKYGGQKQIYIPDRYSYALAGSGLDGHDHTWFKHRARGRGTVLQLTLENDGDKDFHVIGWSTQFYGKRDV